jgi:putative transposase
LSVQAELLGISRRSLYYQPKDPPAEEVQIKHRIDELYTEMPYYGSRRMTAQLRQEGHRINRKAVQRHMREMGIVAIYPGPNLSRRAHQAAVAPYLLRHLTPAYPNHVWAIDITSIRLTRSWLYLVAVIDWYSRYVLAWELSNRLDSSFCSRRSLLRCGCRRRGYRSVWMVGGGSLTTSLWSACGGA